MVSRLVKIIVIIGFVLLLAFLGFILYIFSHSPLNSIGPLTNPIISGAPRIDENGLPHNYNHFTAHPYLLFHDIGQTPGYEFDNMKPWSGWEQAVINSANSSMAHDYSSRWTNDYISFRAVDARDLALAYQITKNDSYADQAKNALLNLNVGGSEDIQMNMTQLRDYCLAYDWVQPYLSSSDDAVIRDKLATIADVSYRALNANGTNREYIETVDNMMQAYPILGIAGVTLNDYTNPHHLPLTSTPQDWQRAGTEYLFTDDALHDYNRSLVSFQWDPTGKDLMGSYKAYYTGDFMWWAQIFTYFYGQNMLDTYPIVKEVFMSEIWDTLPNHYGNDFVTDGNVIYTYQGGIENLLSPADRSSVNFYLGMIDKNLLPYSRVMIPLDTAGPDYLYLMYQDYSNVTGTQPATTSHLNASSAHQVFRDGWSNDSEWLGLITYDVNTLANRNNAHHDQLSFEYYGKGDLLLADAGENRHILDKEYGAFEIDHNTVGFEDTRQPFGTAPWSDTQTRGIFKGSYNQGLVTPSNIRGVVEASWMELVDTNVTVTDVVKNSQYTSMPLSSPIEYERCILFPEKDYFIVIDRLEGSQAWTYHNFFRPTSLNIDPTVDENGDGKYTEDEVGHVIGSLEVEGTAFDWLDNAYKADVPTGHNASLIQWSTTSPYGRDVELQMFTVPSSNVSVGKYVTRIAGYDAENEVYSPVVDLKSDPAIALYRATVLLSNYTDEAPRVPAPLAVLGNGNAITVISAGNTDYVYTGQGGASFGHISTDSDILFLRDSNGPNEYTMINGTSVDYGGEPLVSASDRVDYLALKQTSNDISIRVKTDRMITIRLFPRGTLNDYRVSMDNSSFSSKAVNGNEGLSIDVPAGEHSFEIQG